MSGRRSAPIRDGRRRRQHRPLTDEAAALLPEAQLKRGLEPARRLLDVDERDRVWGERGGNETLGDGPTLARVDRRTTPSATAWRWPLSLQSAQKAESAVSSGEGGFEPPMDRKAHTGFRDRLKSAKSPLK